MTEKTKLILRDYDQLQEIAQSILSEAKQQGANAAQVEVISNDNIASRFGECHITQNVRRNSVIFELQVQMGQKLGSYSGSVVMGGDLKSQISDALTLAKFSPDDPDFPGFLESQPTYPEWSTDIVEVEPMEISDVIAKIIEQAQAVSSKISAVAGNIDYNASRRVLVNSYGVATKDQKSTISGVINVAAQEGTGESRSTSSIGGQHLDGLNAEKAAKTVAERAFAGLNQKELDVGTYPVILAPEGLLDLLWFVELNSSSSSLISHQSGFKDRVGEQVFDKSLTITDIVSDPIKYGSQKFDAEGVPSHDITYLEDGVFKEFAYDRRTAKKMGGDSNGRSIGGFAMFRSATIQPGTKSEEALIESIDNGVFITNLNYTGFVNQPESMITGLTKDGLFMIENGEITHSLKNMRFTDNLFSLFGNVELGTNCIQKIHPLWGKMYGIAGTIPSIRLDTLTFTSKGKH